MVPPKHSPLPPPMNVLHKVAIKLHTYSPGDAKLFDSAPVAKYAVYDCLVTFEKHHKNSLHIRRLLVSKKTTSGKIQLCCVKLNRVSLFFVLNSATYRTTNDLWTVVMITTKWSSDIVGNAQYCVTGNREIGLDMTYTVRTFSTIMTKLARYRTQCTRTAVVNAECWLLNRLRLWRVIFTIRLYHTSSKTLFV